MAGGPTPTLITPASRLIYSVIYSILHLHEMLVFSRWGLQSQQALGQMHWGFITGSFLKEKLWDM